MRETRVFWFFRGSKDDNQKPHVDKVLVPSGRAIKNQELGCETSYAHVLTPLRAVGGRWAVVDFTVLCDRFTVESPARFRFPVVTLCLPPTRIFKSLSG